MIHERLMARNDYEVRYGKEDLIPHQTGAAFGRRFGENAGIGFGEKFGESFEPAAGAPQLSAKALADQLGISSRALEKQINLLKRSGGLQRIGSANAASCCCRPGIRSRCSTIFITASLRC